MSTLPAALPRLARPVLIIPGGAAQSHGLPEITDRLASGENGYGGDYRLDQKSEFVASTDKRANVFNLMFSQPFNSFEHNAGEIRQAIEAVKERTGAPEVDVVAECKGAVEVRRYLQDGGTGIHSLVYLTPMFHGLPYLGIMAALTSRVLQTLHIPLRVCAAVPEVPEIWNDNGSDSQSFETMRTLGSDWKVGPLHGNRTLEALNSPAACLRERDAVHSLTVVAGDGWQLGEGLIGKGLPSKLMSGDQLVPEFAAFVPQANNFFYHMGHGKRSEAAVEKIAETLLTDGHPSLDEHYRTEVMQPESTPGGKLWASVDGFIDRVTHTAARE